MADAMTLKELLQRLAEDRGIDLRGYKPSTLERRIKRRMQQVNVKEYEEYLARVLADAAEAARLLETILIKVTRFFRDPQAWEMMEKEILPELLRKRLPGSTFRVWSAGCASGEEPYSAAIMLCELLGPKIKDYEIKIYATDNHEGALQAARKGEYTQEGLRGTRPEIRAKYFTGDKVVRVTRDIRRMVIFGRANLLVNAPISHVDLLLCRNVLIYFDSSAQTVILDRLKYALNEGGVLFLGKAEAQLKRSTGMTTLNARWRIFQRRPREDEAPATDPANRNEKKLSETANMDGELRNKTHEELEKVKLYYATVLATLEPGVLVLDSGDRVITENEKALKLWELSGSLVGKKLEETEIWTRFPQVKEQLLATRAEKPKSVQFECRNTPTTTLSITIKPIISESGAGQVGTLIYMENVSSRVALQTTIEELESTAEELQSANEELETTNEEMQSTNEELETTNEELQSTNEELETTNEELQSLNEEMETTNEELSSRTQELDQLNVRYSEMMERMPWPVLLVSDDTFIYMFNSAAQKLFGFAHPSEKGMRLQELPLDHKGRAAMVRRHRSVIETNRVSHIHDFRLVTNRFNGLVDIHFTPLSTETGHGVIVMFHLNRTDKDGTAVKTSGVRPMAALKKKPADKNGRPAKKSAVARNRAKKKSGRK